MRKTFKTKITNNGKPFSSKESMIRTPISCCFPQVYSWWSELLRSQFSLKSSWTSKKMKKLSIIHIAFRKMGKTNAFGSSIRNFRFGGVSMKGIPTSAAGACKRRSSTTLSNLKDSSNLRWLLKITTWQPPLTKLIALVRWQKITIRTWSINLLITKPPQRWLSCNRQTLTSENSVQEPMFSHRLKVAASSTISRVATDNPNKNSCRTRSA